MRTSEALDRIQAPWVFKISHRLARGAELRENFEQSLEQFFYQLRQAAMTGDATWLNWALDEWMHSRTQTDFDERGLSLPPILNQMLLVTFDVCQETLEQNDALTLMQTLLPIFLSASEYSARKEMAFHVEYIAQELERANLSLQRLDESKSDFISIAAHELKTPLTLIEGYTSMLREQLPRDENFENPRILLKGMDNGTRRLREIVDDMIDVSLIDNNLLSLNFQPFWLNRLLRVITEEFTGILQDRRQVLEILPFPGIDEMTFGDEERLFQAFRNLFSNAIKYTPDGGRISVDGRKLPGFIEVTVTDTGIGIDPDDHSRIFEKFGRLGNASLHSSGKTKYKGGGPGLGLPITKGIIEAHGGAIWVDSEGFDEVRCPGSTFHVLLPIRKLPPDDKTAKLFYPLTELDNVHKSRNL